MRHRKRYPSLLFIFIGIASTFWLLFRTGRKASRINYPCQRLAAANSTAFFVWVSTILGSLAARFYKQKQKFIARGTVLTIVLTISVLGLRNLYLYSWQKRLVSRPLGAGVSRVVWIRDSRAATGWSSAHSQRVNAQVADEMMNTAIKQLAGKNTVSSAWDQIFKNFNGGAGYSAGEKIIIKANFNNSGTNMYHNPTYQVANALVRQLVEEAGVSQSNIIVYDASRSLQSQYKSGISARFPNIQLNPSRRTCFNTSVRGTKFTCLLDDAKYLINMPLLRTHNFAVVTLSFKNHLGSVQTPNALHDGIRDSSASSNSIVILNNHPLIRDKTLLVVADAMYGLKQGGPDGDPSGSQGIKNPWPSSIFLSTDPVAADSVMLDYMTNRGAEFAYWGSPREPRVYLVAAASIGLGNYDTSLSYNYSKINLIRCTTSTNCSGGVVPTEPPATTSPTAPPLPGDSDGDGDVDGVDYMAWKSHYNQSTTSGPSHGDFDRNHTVDGLDYMIWKANYTG